MSPNGRISRTVHFFEDGIWRSIQTAARVTPIRLSFGVCHLGTEPSRRPCARSSKPLEIKKSYLRHLFPRWTDFSELLLSPLIETEIWPKAQYKKNRLIRPDLIHGVKWYQSSFNLLDTWQETNLQHLFLPENLHIDRVGLICNEGEIKMLPLTCLVKSTAIS